MKQGEFAEIDHTADLGLDLSGPTADAVLEAALRGLVHVLFGGEPPQVEPREERGIELSADSWPELLKAWFEALYRWLEDDGFVPVGARFMSVEPARLSAVVTGDRPPRAAIAGASELKAVTWHGLAFAGGRDGWHGRVIFDV